MAGEMNNTTTTTSTYDAADTVWVTISTILVFIMIPGLGFFYGGITRRKNLLTILLSTLLGLAVVSVQWYIWGFSLSFSETGSFFIGNLDNAFYMGVGSNPHANAPTIPSNLFMVYQGMFAAITPCLAFGSAAERTTMPAYLLFLCLWTTIVYNFITYWCWGPNGWLRALGVVDFAGGTPVHITSGFSALAYAIAVGPRKTVDHHNEKPSNVSDVFMGTAILWFGWFGFNGGSELGINARATNAIIVTNISGSFGGLAWMITEMIHKRTRRMSLNGFCCGAISGLVAITPAAGFVQAHYALVFGLAGGIICFFATTYIRRITNYKYDDACDVLAVHGVGGIVGGLLSGVFAEAKVSTMAGGHEAIGGWVDGNYMLIVYQLISIVAPAAWAFVWTFAILQLINILPCIRLKLTAEEEEIGGDWINLGEVAYGHDVKEGPGKNSKKVAPENQAEIKL